MLPIAFTITFALYYCLALQATENCPSSIIIAPRIGSIIHQCNPVIIGIALKDNGTPAKKKPVIISMNNRKIGTAITNKHGVWSYIPKTNQSLCQGIHVIQARIYPSVQKCLWAQGTMFMVQPIERMSMYKSGNVSSADSLVNFPFEAAVINTSTPIIIGSLLDSSFNPVANETVDLEIDNSSVGSPVSDSNGVFSLQITTPLSDGSHTVTAHCAESNVDLTAISFEIDTVAPDAPIVTSPSENETVTTSTFTVTGTSEAFATIETFLDDDEYGQICYADDNGDWSVEHSATNGVHTMTAHAYDLAGNLGSLSDTCNFTVSA